MTINSKRFFCVVSARSDNAIWGQTQDPMLGSDPKDHGFGTAPRARCCAGWKSFS